MKPFPLPPKMPVPADTSGELTENEYSFILDSTLKPKHRRDPSITAFIESFIRCKSIEQASAECDIHNRLGYQYRHRKDIANAIQKLIDKSTVKHGFDGSEIIQRVKEVVDFDPIAVQNADGSYKSNLHDIEPEARRCIKKLKVKNIYKQIEDLNGMKTQIIVGEIIEYDFYDRLKAAELVGPEKNVLVKKHKVEHALTKDMASILLDSVKRADKAIAAPEKTLTIIEAEVKK